MQIKKAPVKDLVSPDWNPRQITTDEDGEPVLKYDPHRDEIVNIRTGEVVQGH